METSILAFAEQLQSAYSSFQVNDFQSRRFTPEQYAVIVDAVVSSAPDIIRVREAGSSFEGRPIRLFSVGSGQKSVLLWSQMHGDESTATMAIADALRCLAPTPSEEQIRLMLSRLTVHFLPMLNPDGASRFQRRTAQQIDMNRDALALRTPEARILRDLQRELRPQFGFNLHDQELSTVGATKQLSTLALLAPAYDAAQSMNGVRRRAQQLAATFATITSSFMSGSLTRYDDTFEPRAFGDNMQLWGTSTLLVESGHALNDTEKFSIRRINCIGILASLYGLATGAYENTDTDLYEHLPSNGKNAYDLVIRNIAIEHQNGAQTSADLAISYQVDTHTESTPVLADVGDLHTYLGLKEIDGAGPVLPQLQLSIGKPFQWKRYVRC